MADNYLITGYWGEPHVTAENDRGIHAAIFGTGRFVLPVGEQFRAEYIGNNTIRVYDGKLIDNGAAAGIPAGEYVDLLVSEASQGMKRNDLIVFQYEQDPSTLIESGRFVVVKGAEVSGTAADPELTQQDLLTNKATFDQMPMWRVSVSGTTISAPVQLFELAPQMGGAANLAEEAKTAAASAASVASAAQKTANTHASRHASGGGDPITPADIGAAAASHNQAASTVTAGTFAGQVVANSSGQTYGTYCLRNTRLASADTNPTVNGEICWTYG